MDAAAPVAACAERVNDALALRRSHPHAPALDVLDLCLRGTHLPLAGFGGALDPRQPFGLLVAEALDTGMCVQDWKGLLRHGADPAVVQALMQVWHTEVVPRFAQRYSLPG